MNETSIHFLRRVLGDDTRSVQEQLRAPKRRPQRKRIVNKNCGGDTVCQPGLGGKCTACADDQ